MVHLEAAARAVRASLRHGAAGVDALGLLGVDSKHEHLLELHAAAPGAVAARRRQGPRRVQALELALVDLEGPGSHTRRGRREGLRRRGRCGVCRAGAGSADGRHGFSWGRARRHDSSEGLISHVSPATRALDRPGSVVGHRVSLALRRGGGVGRSRKQP